MFFHARRIDDAEYGELRRGIDALREPGRLAASDEVVVALADDVKSANQGQV
jgi:Cdc6-like AAA superfamily ATPase